MSSLVFDILYRDRGAARGFTDLGNRMDRTSAKYAAFQRTAGVAALAIGAAVVKFGAASVKAYSEAESAQAKLGFAFQKFPRLADTNQASLQRLNSALQLKTKYDDDAVASGQAVLAQYKLTGTELTNVTPLLLDYAAKTGKDLPAAASAMGKAFLGNTRALKEIGVNYTSTGDRATDFANITALMRQQVGGFAEKEGKTAAGQFQILRNQVGELQEAAGKDLLPVLTSLTSELVKGVQLVGKYGDVLIPVAAGVGGLAAVVWGADKAQKAWAVSTALTSGLAGRAVGGLNALKVSWTGVELSSVAAGRAMRIAQLSIPVVGIALFGVTTAMAAYASKTGSGATASGEFASAMESVKGSVTLTTAALNENVRAAAAKRLQDAGAFEMARRLGIGLDILTDAALGNEDAILQVNDAIRAGYKGTSDQVQAAGRLGRVLVTTADAARGGAQAERERREAMQTGTTATATAQTAAERMADAQAGLKKSTKELNAELQKSIDKMTILKEGALSQERANLNWEDSLDNLRSSVKENGRSLSDNTNKGRANRRAIVEAMEALDQKTKADFKNSASSKDASKAVAQANDRYRDNRRDLRRAAEAAGYSRAEVDKMIRQYLKTPKKIETDIRNDAEKAQAKVDDYRERLKIRSRVSTNVNVRFGSSGKVALTKGGRMTYVAAASGGILPGYTPGRDVHRFVSPTAGVLDLSGGEAVMVPQWTKAVGGAQAVEKMNADAKAGKLARVHGGSPSARAFADGGTIPSFRPVTRAPWVANRAGSAVAMAAAAAVQSAATAELKKAAKEAASVSGKVDVSAPRGRTSFRGGTFTNLAAAYLRQAERIAGTSFRVYQGGWRPRTSFSGTSHAGDAIDTQASASVVRALRKVGWASGDRTGLGNWMSHAHSVPGPGRGYGRGSAPWQYQDYKRRGGASQSLRSPWGLADGGVQAAPSAVTVAERGPERVLSARQTVSFERLVQGLGRSGGAVTVENHYNFPNYVGSLTDLRRAMEELSRRGALRTVVRQ